MITDTEAQQQKLVDAYLQSLSEKERRAYEIAKSHLETSFQIEKSNGFLHPPTPM